MSFRYAFNGIAILIKTQQNAWIHLSLTFVVIVLGFYHQVQSFEWSLLIIAITMVWLAEAINTAIEFLADFLTIENNVQIGRIKDIAAGAVLLTAIGSAAIGIIVFWPYLY